MAATHVTDAELLAKYPLASTYSNEAGRAAFLERAEDAVEGRLAIAFSLPFAESYKLLKDLILDESYRLLIVGREGLDSFAKDLATRTSETIKGLVDGSIAFITAAGAAVYASSSASIGSTTRDYKPPFDMRDEIDQHIDTDQQDDAEDDDDAA